MHPGGEVSPDGAGGWTADLPSTIRITLALSSLGVMSLPVEVPPSRQWIVLPARNFAQPSDMKSFVERSVASGFRRLPPIRGSRMNVEKLASLLMVACSTC